MDNELPIRLIFFFGVFAFMSTWEVLYPRRILTASKKGRWFNNLSIVVMNNLLVRFGFPVLAIETAYRSAERGWGIFNIFQVNDVASGIIAIIAFDLIIYLQHVGFHLIKPLWRLHMMHHADLDIDVTTGARFHPLEILISMVIKITSIIALGAPPWSVLIFEVLLNATAMFNHSNAYLPLKVDRVLRLLIVTPDMHRVHHSVIIKETNSNYGFNLPWWDRLYGTYRAQPREGHLGMTIGLANFRDSRRLTLPWMLAIPFLGKDR